MESDVTDRLQSVAEYLAKPPTDLRNHVQEDLLKCSPHSYYHHHREEYYPQQQPRAFKLTQNLKRKPEESGKNSNDEHPHKH